MNALKAVVLASCMVGTMTGCLSQPKQDDNIIYYTHFPDSTSIKLKPWFRHEKAFINHITVADNRLYVTDLSDQSSELIYCFDAATGAPVTTYFSRTHQQYGGIKPLSSGILHDGILWFYDPQLSRMVSFDMASNDASLLPEQIKLKSTYRQLVLLNDSMALISGKVRSATNEELSIITLPDENSLHDFETYPVEDKDMDPMMRQQAHQGAVHYYEKMHMAVKGKNLLDEFYIIDLTSKKLVKVRGPEHPDNNGKIKRPNPAADGIMPNMDRRYFIWGGAFTEKYIYLSFTEPPGNGIQEHSNIVLVFDWAGKPLRRIELSTFVSAIAILENTNEIVGFNSAEGMFYKASLNGNDH